MKYHVFLLSTLSVMTHLIGLELSLCWKHLMVNNTILCAQKSAGASYVYISIYITMKG